MDAEIRPFEAHDYEAVAAVLTAAIPDYPRTAEELRYEDEHRDPRCYLKRWVAARDAAVVGWAEIAQSPTVYHPRRYHADVMVDPAHRGRGVGSALYDELHRDLVSRHALDVRAWAREGEPEGTRFLERRGFWEERRLWPSRLDVASVDLASFGDAVGRVRSEGFEIATYRELEVDPARDRKLYALLVEVDRDVPSPEPPTTFSFEWWVKRLDSPHFLQDAYFVALHHGTYVAMSSLRLRQDSAGLYTGLTGTLAAYRRHGLALALKLRGIAYAREKGYPFIMTENDSVNRPMLSINERLGFIRQPAFVGYVKDVASE